MAMFEWISAKPSNTRVFVVNGETITMPLQGRWVVVRAVDDGDDVYYFKGVKLTDDLVAFLGDCVIIIYSAQQTEDIDMMQVDFREIALASIGRDTQREDEHDLMPVLERLATDDDAAALAVKLARFISK